jgi:hypothetical protein
MPFIALRKADVLVLDIPMQSPWTWHYDPIYCCMQPHSALHMLTRALPSQVLYFSPLQQPYHSFVNTSTCSKGLFATQERKNEANSNATSVGFS